MDFKLHGLNSSRLNFIAKDGEISWTLELTWPSFPVACRQFFRD